jgi:hypothetical protein
MLPPHRLVRAVGRAVDAQVEQPGVRGGTQTLFTVSVGFRVFVIVQVAFCPPASVMLPFAAQSPLITES